MAQTLKVTVVGDTSAYSRALLAAGKSTATFGNAATSGFRTLAKGAAIATAGIAAGVAVVGKSSVQAAADFERSMRNVNSIAQLNERQFQQLGKSVTNMAAEVGQKPKVLADGLYDIVSSGFKANDAVKILRVSAKAATAGLTDTATASKAVTAALNAYHLGATDARKVSDILFQTVNKGVLTFDELSQQMGDLVPASAPLGISLEEVGAGMATLTLQGVPAAEAATRLKGAMIQLAKPTPELAKVIKEMGFNSGEAAIKVLGFSGFLQQLSERTKGSVAATAALTPEIRRLLGFVGLTGKNLKTYEENLRSMTDATKGAGITSKVFQEQSKSAAVQWQKFGAAMDVLKIQIGNALLPALNSLVTWVTANMPAIQRIVGSAMQGVSTAISVAVQTIRQHWDQIVGVIRTAIDRIVSTVRAIANFFTTDFGKALLLSAGFLATFVTALRIADAAIKMFAATAALAGGSLPLAALAAATTAFAYLGIKAGLIHSPLQLAATDTQKLTAELKNVETAAQTAGNAIAALSGIDLGLASAKLRVAETAHAVTAAEQAVAQASDGTKKKTLEELQAADALARARLSHKQAVLEYKQAVQESDDAHRKANETLASALPRYEAILRKVAEVGAAHKNATPFIQVAGAHMAQTGEEAWKATFRMKDASPAAVLAARSLAQLEISAGHVAVALGRVPTRKEIIARAKLEGGPIFTAGLQAFIKQAQKAGVEVPKWIRDAATPTKAAATTLATGVKAPLATLPPAGRAAGTGVASGVAQGINAQKGAAVAAAQALKAAVQAVLSTKWGSPPETWADYAVGQKLVQGIAAGIEKGMPAVEGAAAKAKQKIKATLQAQEIAAAIHEAGKTLGYAQAAGVVQGIIQGTPSIVQQAKAALRQAVAAMRQQIAEDRRALVDAFKQMANDALSAFDEATANYTPKAAQQLAKMQIQDQINQAKQAIADAQQQLSTAQTQLATDQTAGPQEGETPEAYAARIKADQDAVVAATKALGDAKRAQDELNLQLEAQKQQEAWDKKRAKEREQLAGELADRQAFLSKHPEQYEKVNKQIIALMKRYHVPMYKAGQAFASRFADGLRDGIGAVAKAARELANALDKYVPHSPAEKGPLAYDSYDAGLKWASQFSAGLAAGGFPQSGTVGVPAGAARTGGAGYAGPERITVMLDSKVLAEATRKELLRTNSRNVTLGFT